MTRRRFYAPAYHIINGIVVLAPEESRHLRDVLRLSIGDEAYVFDGEGRECRCIVREIRGRKSEPSATLEVQEEVAPSALESPFHLSLGVALLKGEKFDLVVQKATELGVQSIIPLMTKRADVRISAGDHAAKRVVRWQRLALEAAKQSGRARVPKINAPVPFGALVQQPPPTENRELRMMFAERAGRSLLETVEEKDQKLIGATALVGPEGGWEDEEIAEASRSEWAIVTLGGRTLRAETAAIMVTGLLQHLYGDLK